MTYNVMLIIRVAIAIALAVIIGNGSVVLFNKVPARWFEDWKDSKDASSGAQSDAERVLPDRLLRSIETGRQRLPSTPWKIVFTGFFVLMGIFLAFREPLQFEVGTMIVLAIVLEMAISDTLYMVVPDQFSMMLAASAVGFVGMHDNWWEPFAGAGAGLALSLLVYGLGRIFFKRTSIGGADIKFYISIGLVAGITGVISIFVITSVLTGLQAAAISYQNRGVVNSERDNTMVPMLPSAFVATTAYLLLLWEMMDVIVF